MNKDKTRIKNNGEVFTPPDLVTEMLNQIPHDVIVNTVKTIIDPACGDGNFLVAVLQRRLDAGCDPRLSLKTIYGVELMPDNVKRCQDRLISLAGEKHRDIVNTNIACSDAFEWDFERWAPKGNLLTF